jgi:lysine 2,3-aminomutase
LRGRVSGLCQPSYMLDLPGGHGKVPIGPCYAEPVGKGWRITDPRGREHAYPPVEGSAESFSAGPHPPR